MGRWYLHLADADIARVSLEWKGLEGVGQYASTLRLAVLF